MAMTKVTNKVTKQAVKMGNNRNFYKDGYETGKNWKNGYIIAWFAAQIGKTVEDVFLEYVYNNSYELVEDLWL